MTPTENPWVSIEDKLPKESTWCIVFGPGHFQVAQYNENGYWSPAYGFSSWNVYNITHWTPLPPPPHHFPDAGKMVDHIVSEDKKV